MRSDPDWVHRAIGFIFGVAMVALFALYAVHLVIVFWQYLF